MRFEGTLRQWDDARGFGFVTPTDGGQDIFVHISAFPRDGRRPQVGEMLSFELGMGANGKKHAQQIQRPPSRPAQALHTQRPRHTGSASRPSSSSFGSGLIALALVIALGAVGYTKYTARTSAPAPAETAPAPASTAAVISPAPPINSMSSMRCDGRKHCSQMTSCTEAKFFLKNCPGAAMDGNNDGVPCEQQWCTSPYAP